MRHIIVVLIMLGGISAPVAETALITQPLDIEADSLDIETVKGVATFEGRVKLTHDGMTLACDTLTLYTPKTNGKTAVESAVARGNVTLNFSSGTATGTTATWQPKTNSVLLEGNVRLTQQGSTLTGQKLIYDLNRKNAKITSGNSGRVKATFGGK